MNVPGIMMSIVTGLLLITAIALPIVIRRIRRIRRRRITSPG